MMTLMMDAAMSNTGKHWYGQQAASPIQVSELVGALDAEHGMSLRDYFAAAALSGLCNEAHGEAYTPEGAAGRAVRMADALILELAK